MAQSLIEISRCDVCGSEELRAVLELGRHPMCDDLVPIGDLRECKEYPIEILFCNTCLTAHQRFQIPKAALFPSTYHYRSRQTADVLNGMRDLVVNCEAQLGALHGRTVLDIGCNDGSLLSIFRERGASTFGIEPTGAAHDAIAHGHVVLNKFLDEAVAREFAQAHGQPAIITFTNVFAHIEDLHGVLEALKVLSSPATTLIVENHYLGSILSASQFDTFYHEHPRTYSFTSFRYIARALGMQITKLQFPRRYGGNIRVFMSGAEAAADEASRSHHDRICADEASLAAGLTRLSTQVENWRTRKRAELEAEYQRNGRLRAKAFPGRAAISIKLLGLDETRIEAVYEKPGSGKIGHYVPGTRIPIKSDSDFSLATHTGSPLLNLAWHIRNEIETYMRDRGYQGPIIDIIGPEDFAGPHERC
jgi:hypothetical protein